ncbi:MAG: hypothetical protein CALGDGBN_02553 [Pseudomonadales bacterium]|nr:hypothetical protein [Pseudomonadales bacterium]
MITTAGSVPAGTLRLEVAPEAAVDSIGTLGNLVVTGDTDSGLVRLLDEADVYRDYVDPPALLLRRNGKPAIGLGVSNVLGGNVVAMGDAVKQRLAELEGQRPVGILAFSAIGLSPHSRDCTQACRVALPISTKSVAN